MDFYHQEAGIDYRPISRAYYELTEIMKDFEVVDPVWLIKSIRYYVWQKDQEHY